MTDFSELIPSRTNSPFRRKAFEPSHITNQENGIIVWFADWQWDGNFGDVIEWMPQKWRNDLYYSEHLNRFTSSEFGITTIIEEFSDEYVKAVAFS